MAVYKILPYVWPIIKWIIWIYLFFCFGPLLLVIGFAMIKD